MSKTLLFYLARQVLIATIIVALVLSSALWLAQSIKLVELVINGGAPLSMFFKLMGLTFPNLITPILPLCFFFGVLFVYLRLYQDSELIVLRGVGLSPFQLAWPILMIAGLAMLTHFMFTLKLAPESLRELRRQRHVIATEYSAAALREGTFNSLNENLTVYVHERVGIDSFHGIMIHDTRDKNNAITITATSGNLVHNTDNPRLIIQNGTRQEYAKETNQFNWLEFKEYAVDLNTLQPDRDEGFVRASERPISELFSPPSDVNDIKKRNEFFSEAHQRLASPLWVLAYGAMALATLFCGAYRRRGIFSRIIVVCLGAVFLQGIIFGLNSFTERSNEFVTLLYAFPVFIFAAGFYFLFAAQRGKI